LVPKVRSLLGAFLFRGDEVEKKIRVLSGGERNRFALMLMLLRPANLLLLDEPTNHLDIEAQEVLLHALRSFSGTVVFVSHDHYFLSQLATRVVEVGGGGIRDHPGDYESYLWKKERETSERLERPADKENPEPPAVKSLPSSSRTQSQRERRAAKKLDEIESRIGLLEKRRAKLEELMATDGFFRDPEKSQFYLKDHRELLDELNLLYEEWNDLQDEVNR
jgi:ATP-binding cassette subfamily F protein 3